LPDYWNYSPSKGRRAAERWRWQKGAATGRNRLAHGRAKPVSRL